jgi:class 3 adenylate cyclase/pSer/pThr/pTyr-binding forkhead associated (FHA) protein
MPAMKQQDESSKLKELIERKKQLDLELAKLSKLVTVMFTDIVGSTSYFEKHGDVAGLVYVHKCIDMLSPIAEKHGGTVCKTIGDAVMAYFNDPVNAVLAAIEMQRTLDAYNAVQLEVDEVEQKIFVRIGLNYGPGMVKDNDVFGDAVNTAARVESLAKGEQILISAASKLEKDIIQKWVDSVRAAKIPLREIPDVSLKGKAEKLVVYEVLWREMKAEQKVEVAPLTPQMAGRVNVSKAAELPSDRQSGVFGASPLSQIAKPKVIFSLVVVRPDGTHGQECRLDRSSVVLGRVEGDIKFPDDPLVSRKHARFAVSAESLAVEDLKSANGIFLRLNKPRPLQDGDILLMGRQMFRFVTPRRDAPAGDSKPSATQPPAAGGVASAELVKMLPGGVEDKHFPLNSGENILGRTRGSITFPEDAYLSSQHCRIIWKDGKFVLEDLKAVNGTFVGVREKTPLSDGDILLIGHQLLRVTATAP